MKILDLSVQTTSKNIGSLVESYFGKKVDFSSLTERQTKKMLKKATRTLKEYKMSSKRHNSETDKSFLQLMFVAESLAKHLKEMDAPVQTAIKPNSPEAKKIQQSATKAANGQAVTGDDAKKLAATAELNQDDTDTPDPEKDQILKKAKQGQTVSGEQAKKLSAMLTTEDDKLEETFKNLYKDFVVESTDVDQAQVVLAAQDMVDSVQDMLEKISKMKVEELYPLNDSITAVLGSDKAQAFSSNANETLQAVLDALETARQDMSGAVAALTGDDIPDSFAQNVDSNADEGSDMGDTDNLDLGLGNDKEEDNNLGRERR